LAKKIVTLDHQTFEVHYEVVNSSATHDIVFLHGWGSNKAIMKQAFATSLANFRHIYIDMPGFGKSTNDYILTTQDYATIMEQFLTMLDAKRDIIVGHSFGGKVAALLAPKMLVLLSSAGIVLPKSLKVRAKIALFKWLKRFGFQHLRKFFVADDAKGMSEPMYETFKNVVDEDFSPIFEAFNNETIIFWGKEDSATPLHAGERIATLTKTKQFYPIDGDHYFFLQQGAPISEKIEEVWNGL
jgi:pimeloyl-ACP methyl ester carboxylesterase